MKRLATAWGALAPAAALVTFLAGCGGGRDADRSDRPLLTIEQEIEIGRAAAPCFERLCGGRLENLPVQAYVRTVGERVARCTPMDELPYRFAVLDGGDVNAFALPGGPVYVTRGLLVSLRTEGQLAAALAHQLAHINTRRVGRAVCRKLGKDVLLRAIADAGEAGAARRVAAAILELDYEPGTEDEADRLGLDYIVAAGYNPREMIRFLNRTAVGEGVGVAQSPGAHPDPAGRLGRVREMIDRKYRDRGGRVADEEYRSEVLDRLGNR